MTCEQLDLFDSANERQTIAERIMQYGVRGLGDSELIECLISPYLSARMDSRKLADTILSAMDGNTAPPMEEFKAINPRNIGRACKRYPNSIGAWKKEGRERRRML